MPTIVDALLVTLGLDASNYTRNANTAMRTNAGMVRAQQQLAAAQAQMQQATTQAQRNAAQQQIQIAQRNVQTQVQLQRQLLQSQRALREEISLVRRNTTDAYSEMTNQLLKFFAVLSFGRGLKEFVNDLVTSDATIGRFARTIDASVGDVSRWSNAVETVGGSAAGIQASMGSLEDQLQQIRLTGDASVIPVFRALGVSVADAQGKMRPLNDIMIDLHKSIQGMDPAQSTSILKMLGLDRDTINLLQMSDSSFNKLMSDMDKFGLTTEESARQSAQLQAELGEARIAFNSLGRSVLVEVLPVFNEYLRQLLEWYMANKDMINSRIIEWVKALVNNLRTLFRAVQSIVDAVGGWRNAMEILFAVWAGGRLLGFIGSLGRIYNLMREINGLRGLTGIGPNPNVGTSLVGSGASAASGVGGVIGGAAKAAGVIGMAIGAWQLGDYVNRNYLDTGKDGLPNLARNVAFDVNPTHWTRTYHTEEGQKKKLAERQADFVDYGVSNLNLSPVAAAGIAGSGTQESTMGVNMQEKHPIVAGSRGGLGVFQWTGPRRVEFENWARKNNMDPNKYETSMEFLKWDLQRPQWAKMLSLMRAARTTDEASQIFNQYYESGGDPRAVTGKRDQYAADAYQAWQSRQGRVSTVAAVPPASLGAAASSQVSQDNSRQTQVSVGTVNVQTHATDSRAIAATIGPAIQQDATLAHADTGLM